MKAVIIFVRALAATFLLLAPTAAQAQLDVLKKAKQIVEQKLPSIESLYGDKPPITSSFDDAKDGVSLLDSFIPKAFSPMDEMPRGQDMTIQLVPGTYAMMTTSYCLKPGTYGPQRGDGYLHVEWEGPKADIITALISRAAAHPEIAHPQLQTLLWAIIARAEFKNFYREQQIIAATLLTPSELLDLSGYGLKAVPDALQKRVLESVPEPVRRILEAENEMRRMFSSAETRYADLEQVAVRNGVIPESESGYIIPRGRWSYHPAGFFIRYAPEHYSHTRIEIYYPQSVEIRRDASGRIISIASADGRRLDLGENANGVLQLANLRSSEEAMQRTRIGVINRAMQRMPAGDARRDLLMLAEVDYLDLAAIQDNLESVELPQRSATVGVARSLVREAVHAALARYIGIARSQTIERGSALEASIRPVQFGGGVKYVVAPVSSKRSTAGHYMPAGWYGPSGGGAVAPGKRQRLGMGMGPPMFLAGGNDPLPAGPDALDKAMQMTGALDNANNVLGAFTDPAGLVGGAPGGWMMGQGLDAAFAAARRIGNALSGDGGSAWIPGFARGRDVALTSSPQRAMIIPVSLSNMRMIGSPVAEDYQTFARPKTIQFTPLAPKGFSVARAKTLNSAVATSLRMATALNAMIITRERLVAAIEARDLEWQEKQGRALIYLKRTSGVEMVKLASELEALKKSAPPGAIITEDEVRESQRRLRTEGVPAEAVAIASQLGRTAADVERQRQRVLSLDPKWPPVNAPAAIQKLQDALVAYGSHLALLPEVAPPWN